MIQKILLSIFLLLSAQVHANDWSGKTKIKEIIAGYKEAIILFTTVNAHHNPGDCAAEYYTVSEKYADLDIVFSLLLAAQKSGAEILVGVDPTKCGSESHATGRINVTRIKSL